MRKIVLLIAAMATFGCCKEKPLPVEVRGVWVPDPQYTDVLKSYDNVKAFVAQLDELNMNSIFLVSYALTKTIYPSQVLLNNTNYDHIDSTNMLLPFMAEYKSESGEPVRDLINEAHKRDIRVIFWFEFGFMGDIKPISADNNPILAKNPTWIGVGNDGLAANYNKGDYYFNSYDPAVQDFLIALIEESLRHYPDVDGIQGDDRMPAAPRNSGYDPVTVARYRAEKGIDPPADFNQEEWVRWRLGILNEFGKRLYSSVKTIAPDAIVSFSPNPYPWCEENLMQEWPQWVADSICDLLAVQCYRRDSTSYANTVKGCMENVAESRADQIFAPGVLLMVGGGITPSAELEKQIRANRALGTNGEIFFYNEGLREKSIQDMLKRNYTTKAKFPKR